MDGDGYDGGAWWLMMMVLGARVGLMSFRVVLRLIQFRIIVSSINI